MWIRETAGGSPRASRRAARARGRRRWLRGRSRARPRCTTGSSRAACVAVLDDDPGGGRVLVGGHDPGALGGAGGRDLLADQGVEQRGLAALSVQARATRSGPSSGRGARGAPRRPRGLGVDRERLVEDGPGAGREPLTRSPGSARGGRRSRRAPRGPLRTASAHLDVELAGGGGGRDGAAAPVATWSAWAVKWSRKVRCTSRSMSLVCLQSRNCTSSACWRTTASVETTTSQSPAALVAQGATAEQHHGADRERVDQRHPRERGDQTDHEHTAVGQRSPTSRPWVNWMRSRSGGASSGRAES